MSERGEVLVAIINNKRDFAVVRGQGWYRIPVSSMHKWLQDRWPPQWLLFTRPRNLGRNGIPSATTRLSWRINKASRRDLFPSEPENDKSSRIYYQLWLGDLRERPIPILSRRWRRIVFIPTTWDKFNTAWINDLYDESPLEDRLWAELKRHKIPAERQES